MAVLPQAMIFLGIIPALVLLYISLKGYEGIYKEKTIFITFILGIIVGVVSIIIEYLTLAIGMLSIILFPILEQMFKTMILNLRRLQGKRETTVYGLSLGVGFGSVFIPYYIIITTLSQTGDLYTISSAFLGSLGILLLHGSTGVAVGYGVYSSKLPKYFIISILLYLPVFILYSGLISIAYLPIGLLPYGIVVYWFVTSKIMPQILNRDQRRKRDKSKV
ncbi:MAG: protease PrsW [Candidatus Thermoplasmatota archaeon]|nr:protease PrsW [Candidatus Thermoplasmatota archaeon]